MRAYWANVWSRIIARRLDDPTWQATFTIPEGFESNRCFNTEYMKTLKNSDDAAWDVFTTDFSHLRPDLQIALSGATRSAWLERDRAEREKLGLL